MNQLAILKTYQVRRTAAAVRPDGTLGEPAWRRAVVLTDFRFPWTDAPAPSTEFRAMADRQRLFFAYRVADEDLVLVDKFQDKLDVVKEDRVEIFFARDRELKEYFCLELDPLGRTLDYRASYYRRFDRSWNCPGLRVAAARTPAGYTVEASVPLGVLAELGLGSLDSEEGILTGLFRAEFHHGPDGQTVEDWISWVDPGTKIPDFHVPAAFGRLRRAPSCRGKKGDRSAEGNRCAE